MAETRSGVVESPATLHRVTMAVVAVLLVVLALTHGAIGQAQQASDPTIRTDAADAFDVASVKLNRSGEGQRGIGFQPGGRFRARNMTVRGMIAAAYGSPQPLPLFRVVGGPSWIDADRYDVEASTSADVAASLTPPWPPRGQAMLRALLRDRFKLGARQELQSLPAYELVRVNPGANLGPQLQISTGADCTVPVTGGAQPGTDQIPCGGFGAAPPDRLSGRYLTMDQFARFLSLNVVERPVVNRTGLTSHYSWELDYTRNLAAAPGVGEPAAPSGISVFTALTEQLGLKLQPTSTPLDVVIVDSIDRPTPD